jgi:N-dimethylarginine dimethylaminohydrolase
MTRILMVRPDHFNILYAINPHMADEHGSPKKVDRARALVQWENLKKIYEKHDVKVDTLAGAPGLPDMVFCANQSFPFISREGRWTVVLGKMKHSERQAEVEHFRRYYLENGYDLFETPDDVSSFEAMGDALIVPNRQFILGGFGKRTDPKIYDYLSKNFGFEILKLKLLRDDFYHLDTCVVVLDGQTVAYVPSSIENPEQLKKYFSRTIEISEYEALQYFAGNAFCFDGHHVILQKGSKKFCADLNQLGFEPIEVDTGEFIKAGGSVFCMKMQIPQK